MYREFLEQFFIENNFPQEGALSLLRTLEQIRADQPLWDAIREAVLAYETGGVHTPDEIKALLSQVRASLGSGCVPAEEAELLFFLLCMKRLRVLYENAGLPMDYYRGVASDLRSKLNECHAVRSIWGSFVADWFVRFFALDRFVIGRLQYELISIPQAYCTEETAHFAGKTAVNVHIPSGTPLRQEDVRSSMQEAARFFAGRFPEGNIPFVCHSWLLFPGHREMLPESSGIRLFMEEFTIISSYIDETKHDLWRIFHTDNIADLDALPQDTSLQRAYIQWLKAGNSVGGGMGLRYIRV